MNNYIHKIIDFFFHHEVSDEIIERVYNRMVFPVEDKAREEAVSQIWDKLDDASCSDEKIEKAFYNLETSLEFKKEEQTIEFVHREHIRNTKRINWGRVAAIWTIPFIMVCVSAYHYYSAKDYVKETLSEVTYMQRYAAMGTREEVFITSQKVPSLACDMSIIIPNRFISFTTSRPNCVSP